MIRYYPSKSVIEMFKYIVHAIYFYIKKQPCTITTRLFNINERRWIAMLTPEGYIGDYDGRLYSTENEAREADPRN